MKKYILFLIPLMVYLMSGCAKTENPDPNIDDQSSTIRTWDEDFELTIGETVRIEPGDLIIEATDISEDSRCPSKVVCVWAGRVTVQLEIEYLGIQHSVALSIGGSQESDAVIIDDIEVKLLSVLPYPEEPGGIEKEDYIIILKVQETV